MISRTQSEVLYYYLDQFIKLWAVIENEKMPIFWQREEGTKWLRQLNLSAFQDPKSGNVLANCLCQYIKILDEGLKLFFGHLGDEEQQYQKLKQYYIENYRQMDEMI